MSVLPGANGIHFLVLEYFVPSFSCAVEQAVVVAQAEPTYFSIQRQRFKTLNSENTLLRKKIADVLCCCEHWEVLKQWCPMLHAVIRVHVNQSHIQF